MLLSIVTDEISADLETSVELAKEWGLTAVELRGISDERFPRVSEFWKTRVPELLQKADMKVSAISSGLFKIPYPGLQPSGTRILRWEDNLVYRKFKSAEALVRDHLENLLPMTFMAAKQLGVSTVVCFSFDRGEGVSSDAPVPQGVYDALTEAAHQAEAENITLVMEVEHICWGDTGKNAARIVEKIGSPALGINWDPANAYRAGEEYPFPEGYAAVRQMVRHVHFKDARKNPFSGEKEFVFDGIIDWPGQIKALVNDEYSGYISVETHAQPKVAMARQSLAKLRNLIQEAQL
ncbi:MAG: hypothetical protein BGO78_12770 [Chloroflexi bacterium 44-23]|nr:MAG: hypothetical protein BGO78_12770 [Chloroflexi bacterium 44-23]